jgi:predicted RNA-binding Zn-ribbon protein involved in translation (DUF1610 family)
LASLFLYHRYNVCPHCGWLLPSRTLLIPTYCPECGKKLSDLPE